MHQYRTLDQEEQREIIEQQVGSLGGRGGGDRRIEKDAVALIIRMTGGNFRRMERLLSQMDRIVQINADVDVVSKEVVEAAREQLVFGRGERGSELLRDEVQPGKEALEKKRVMVLSRFDRGWGSKES